MAKGLGGGAPAWVAGLVRVAFAFHFASLRWEAQASRPVLMSTEDSDSSLSAVRLRLNRGCRYRPVPTRAQAPRAASQPAVKNSPERPEEEEEKKSLADPPGGVR